LVGWFVVGEHWKEVEVIIITVTNPKKIKKKLLKKNTTKKKKKIPHELIANRTNLSTILVHKLANSIHMDWLTSYAFPKER